MTATANHVGVANSYSGLSGALVIRIWAEQGASVPLRARITHSNDIEGRERVTSTASSADDIERTVRTWLDSFVGSIRVVDSGRSA